MGQHSIELPISRLTNSSPTCRGPGAVEVPLPYKRFNEHMTWIRGLHFTLGWQTDRIKVDLPWRVLAVWLGIAIIWLCVILGKGAGADWGTAFAFAQVAAASLALLVAFARH